MHSVYSCRFYYADMERTSLPAMNSSASVSGHDGVLYSRHFNVLCVSALQTFSLNM